MKKIFTVLFIILCTLNIAPPFASRFIGNNCMGQWYQLNSGTSVNLNKIQFVNSQTGWACGNQSAPTQYILVKTTNGGLNWVNQITNFPFGNRTMSLFFVNVNTGWVAGADGIFKTTNGGENYFTITNPSPIVYDCCFLNANTGWAVGLEASSAKIAKTTNGGTNWVQQVINIGTEQLFYVKFVNENTGWCTGPNTIIKTTNGGINWFSQSHPSVSFINRIFAVSPDLAFITADCYVLITTNGGMNWVQRLVNPNYYAMDAYFLNANKGYVCTSSGNVYKTLNSGVNWTVLMGDTTQSLNNFYFTSSDTGYVCGYGGRIFKTINGGAIKIKLIGENIPEKFQLYQNYPNPFNPSTIIKYMIAENGKWKTENGIVTLKVFDILGKEVATLVNEKQSAGVYEVTWDAAGYPGGVYFYKLTAGDFPEVKRMVLIK
jgi:photosystem II stability/assembly factor-like uncharacterized protein